MHEDTFDRKGLDEYVKSFGLVKALHTIQPHQITDDFLRKLWQNLINEYVQVLNYVKR